MSSNSLENSLDAEFIADNKAILGGINLQDEVWFQNVHVMAPINQEYEDINVFTYYQQNVFNFEKTEIEYYQAWPRLMPSGEIAWAMQLAVTSFNDPVYRFKHGKPVKQPQTYSLRFVGPLVVDSSITSGGPSGAPLAFYHTATSPVSTVDEFYDSVTGQSVLNEVVTVIVPHKRRYYSNSLQLFIDPTSLNNIVLWSYFDSIAAVPPQVITDALNAFKAGTVQYRPDPQGDGTGPDIPLYIPSIDNVNNNSMILQTAQQPESPSSKNHGFKGYCFVKNGKVVTTKQ